jgi:hypothetical protein
MTRTGATFSPNASKLKQMKNNIKNASIHFKSDFFLFSVIGIIIMGGGSLAILSLYFYCEEFCKTYKPLGNFHAIQYDIYTEYGTILIIMGITSALIASFISLLNVKAISDLNKIKELEK